MTGFILPAAAAGIGGLLGGFGGSGKRKKVSRFNKQQQQLFDLLGDAFTGGGGPFGDIAAPFDEQAARARFEQSVAQPAIQNFQERTIPGITGQFRGKNLGESSFLGAELTKGGQDLESGLAAQLGETLFQGRESATNRRMQALQNFLGSQTFDFQDPSRNIFDRILGGAGMGLQASSPFANFGGGGAETESTPTSFSGGHTRR